MSTCKVLLLDLVKRTAGAELNSQGTADEVHKLAQVRNLDEFCRQSVRLVKANFESVLQQGIEKER